MNENIYISYNTAKRFLLDLLENNDFSKDKDIIKVISSVMRKESASCIAKRDLSRIIIDKNCQVFLSDYSSHEIKMPHPPKTVFLFFLFHAEGVEFKSMHKHISELYGIYQVVALDKYVEAIKIRRSIKNWVEPTNNRIYEVCSIIRKALSVIAQSELLEQYCIVGKRGKLHQVLVNRELMCIENEKLRYIQTKY